MNIIENNINGWLDCLESKAKVQTYGNQNIYFIFKRNPKYYKIIQIWDGDESIHAFVDKKNGDVYKPASWNAPYKDARYNLITEYDKILNNCDWAGVYLYKS